MPIENVDDLAESLADAAGVWGSCSDSEWPSCTQTRWCRVCWKMYVKRRIWAAAVVEHQQLKAGQTVLGEEVAQRFVAALERDAPDET